MANGIGLQVVELIKGIVLQLDLMMPADKFVSTSKPSYITHTVQLHINHDKWSRITGCRVNEEKCLTAGPYDAS